MIKLVTVLAMACLLVADAYAHRVTVNGSATSRHWHSDRADALDSACKDAKAEARFALPIDHRRSVQYGRCECSVESRNGTYKAFCPASASAQDDN